MRMAVRSMAPDVVCTDEIGTKEDADALKYLSISGVNFIVTMHGYSLEDIYMSDVYEIIEKGYVSKVIVLNRENGIGEIKKVYSDLKK
jgi:stage III sporulation protein AA